MNGEPSAVPAWKLPEGVNASLWHYAHERRLAEDEDEYFRDHPLFRADTSALDARFVDPAPLIDLGCGAGRLSIRFAAKGFPVVAVDLSRPMLECLARKAKVGGHSIATVQANLCDLGCFHRDSFSYALMMFSTLGMVRGTHARRKALMQVHQILEPGGRLALHAHNLWLNLRDSQGRRWLLAQGWRALRGMDGLGDRSMMYRGVPGMEVHLYRWDEIRRVLNATGFEIEEILPINEVTALPIAAPWLLHAWRAGGWLIFARKRIRR